ncbi:MAG TPA: site-2 protease family protein [Polyangiaceae bacterium]|jgi:Zn-dependent protease
MNAFRLGRVFGIEIRVDWSWVFIFVLMTWNLASGFVAWHPDWPGPERVLVAAVASVLFFACVLAHELAHSVVATRLGLRVRSITLFLFGGVSNIEHEPPSAGSEFATAVVGPLTSLVLGVLFVALASALTPFSVHGGAEAEAMLAQLGPGATLLAWLGPVNIGVGLFNLIPAFPLDGGRVLRATLWGLSKDWRFATMAASAIAQVVGWGFIVAGIAMSFGATLPLVGAGVSSGLWLAFIGWWVHSAASQSFRRIAQDDPGGRDPHGAAGQAE